MKWLTRAATAFLFAVASSYATTPVTSSVATVSSTQRVGTLLEENQAQFLAISPPSEDIYIHKLKRALPVDWSGFDPVFLSMMYADMVDIGGVPFPVYTIFVTEDEITRERVIYNSFGTEVLRVPPPVNYNPYLFMLNLFMVDSIFEIDPFYRWIFDPAHIALEIPLVPIQIYEDYLDLYNASLPPPPPPPGPVAPPTELRARIDNSTQGDIIIDWPDNFSGLVDLFATSDLASDEWELVLIGYISDGQTNVVWSDPNPGEYSTRFFRVGNGSNDSDGDFLPDLHEALVFKTNPQNPDTDGDGIYDGDEVSDTGQYGDTDGLVTNPFKPDRSDFTLPYPIHYVEGPAEIPEDFAPFNPPFNTMDIHPEAPVIAEWNRINNPGDTMALTAEKISGTDYGNDIRFKFFGQVNAPAKAQSIPDGKIVRHDGRQAAITLPSTLPPHEMYFLWPFNKNGWGAPVAINQTDSWWVGPDTVAEEGTFSVFGRNLILDPEIPTTHLYIEDEGGTGRWLESTAANPYRADFDLPSDLEAGTYTLWTHNGFGGEYGWGRALTLNVEEPIEWSGSTYNVKDYGAVGDGSSDDTDAIQDALSDAKNDDFATVYFPEGTYLVSESLHDAKYDMRLMGDGMDKTTITTHPDYGGNPDLNFGLIYSRSQTGPVEFHDMTLSTGEHMLNVSSIGPQVVYTRDGTRSTFVNVRFSQFDHPDLLDHKAIINMEGMSYVNFIGCEFILAGAVDVNAGGRQILFDNCTFKAIHENEFMVNIGASSEARVLNCTAMNYDNSDPDSSKGWGQGRFVYGPGSNGGVRDVYYSGNETIDLTVREKFTENQNTGEQYMTEFNRTLHRGVPVTATENTVELASLTGEEIVGQTVVVVGGTGIGQNRKIESRSGDVITITEDWNVIPDQESIVMVGNYAARHVVYLNKFDGVERAVVTDVPSTAGVMPYGSQVDMVVDSNDFHQLKHGISLWGIQNEINGEILCRPLYFNQFMNNTLRRCRRAIDNSIATYSGTPTYWDINLLGNVFRNNTITNSTEYAFRNRTWEDAYSIAMCIYDSNTSIDCETNIGDDRGLRNQVWINNSFTTFIGGTGIETSDDHKPALKNNTWNGFDSNYGGDEPGAILEAPTRATDAFEGTQQQLNIWNAGTEPMYWLAVEASPLIDFLPTEETDTFVVDAERSITAAIGLVNAEDLESHLVYTNIGFASEVTEAHILVVTPEEDANIITLLRSAQDNIASDGRSRTLYGDGDADEIAGEIDSQLFAESLLEKLLTRIEGRYSVVPKLDCRGKDACFTHLPEARQTAEFEAFSNNWPGIEFAYDWDPGDLEDFLAAWESHIKCRYLQDINDEQNINRWVNYWRKEHKRDDCAYRKEWPLWDPWEAYWSNQANWSNVRTWEQWQKSWISYLLSYRLNELKATITAWLNGTTPEAEILPVTASNQSDQPPPRKKGKKK